MKARRLSAGFELQVGNPLHFRIELFTVQAPGRHHPAPLPRRHSRARPPSPLLVTAVDERSLVLFLFLCKECQCLSLRCKTCVPFPSAQQVDTQVIDVLLPGMCPTDCTGIRYANIRRLLEQSCSLGDPPLVIGVHDRDKNCFRSSCLVYAFVSPHPVAVQPEDRSRKSPSFPCKCMF